VVADHESVVRFAKFKMADVQYGGLLNKNSRIRGLKKYCRILRKI